MYLLITLVGIVIWNILRAKPYTPPPPIKRTREEIRERLWANVEK